MQEFNKNVYLGYGDVDVDISVDEFLKECDEEDIEEVLDFITENWPAKITRIMTMVQNCCAAESEFEEAVNKLHHSWKRLSGTEEKTILDIAKRL